MPSADEIRVSGVIGLRAAFVALTGLVLSLLVAGCYPLIEHPLTPKESDAIKDGSNAVVLVRFVGQDQNGERLKPFADWDYMKRLGIALGNFDSGGMLRAREVRALSPAARDEGWVTLILVPGYHYLVFGMNSKYNVPYRADSLPRWRIEVPRGAPLIYAGTFHLSAMTGPFLFEGRGIQGIDQAATVVEDETEAAVQAARRDLPTLPQPVTRLAVLHTGSILLDVPPPVRPFE